MKFKLRRTVITRKAQKKVIKKMMTPEATLKGLLGRSEYSIIDPAKIRDAAELFAALPQKLQKDILEYAYTSRKAGKGPVAVFDDILDAIDGAIELMTLDASESDRHRPPLISREEIKILAELGKRHIDYDEHFRRMEELLAPSSPDKDTEPFKKKTH